MNAIRPTIDALLRELGALFNERETTHGDFRKTLQITADFWTAYFGVTVTAADVAVAMDLHKLARIKAGGSQHREHWLDRAGYAVLALALHGPARERSTVKVAALAELLERHGVPNPMPCPVVGATPYPPSQGVQNEPPAATQNVRAFDPAAGRPRP